jgi:hypothetical protein
MGGLSGTVRDASGAVVTGAEVEVVNAAKGIQRSVETDEDGLFVAPALAPAKGYRVTVSKPGFTKFLAEDIEILVGRQVDLPVTLYLTTEIAAGPPVQQIETEVSQVIESGQIVDLPLNGRRVDNFTLLTPGVTRDGYLGLLTFRGTAGGNSFLVDGNDTTEQFYNENEGRTHIFSQISQDAVQEFQVILSNPLAEYGRATGGIVNTVTRSGANERHGTAFWFFRNRTLDARDRYASVDPAEVRNQAGTSTGGAIRRDKLFYFFNAEVTRRSFPIASSLVAPGVIDPLYHTFIGCASPATASQCAAINALLPRFFARIPRKADQTLALGRIDWRPSAEHSFTASFNFLHFSSPNGLLTDSAITTGSALTGNANDNVRVRNVRGSWTAIPREDMTNEFRFGWDTDRQTDDFCPLTIAPGAADAAITVAGVSLGSPNFLPRVEPNERRLEFADNFSRIWRKHIFKAGLDIAGTDDHTHLLTNAFGNYTYQTVTTFAEDYSSPGTLTSPGKHWLTYTQGFGTPVVDAGIRDNGIYGQDQYHFSQNLTVNVGVRYEHASMPYPPKDNPNYPQTGTIPSSAHNLAPRLGLAYNFDRAKTVVRASWGMFHARFPASLVYSLLTNNGVYQTATTLQSTVAAQLTAGPPFPNQFFTTPSSAVGSTTIQFLEPKARTPYAEEGSLSLERPLASGITMTASYLWNRGIQLLGVRDLNMGAPTGSAVYTIEDAHGNVVGAYATPVYLTSNRLDSRYQRILQDENGVNSYYNALLVQLGKRFRYGLQGNISYTWSHEIDYGQGDATDALFFNAPVATFNGNYKLDKGSGTLDQRHRFVLSFVEQPVFTHRAGRFYKYLVNNWQLSALMTLESGRPEMPYVFLTDTPVTNMAYSTTLNGFGGGDRAPFWRNDSLYTPPVHRGDARLSKIVPIGERYKVIVSFEAFNVTNTPVNTSLYNEAYIEKGKVLTPYAAYGAGYASTGFPDGTNARRAQASARFVF